MDKTPQEIWEGLTPAQQRILVRAGDTLSRRDGEQIPIGLTREVCFPLRYALTSLGRAVAEHGRKDGAA